MAKKYLFGADLSYVIAMGVSALLYYAMRRRTSQSEVSQPAVAHYQQI
ncbi:MAG: hypothetical protein ACYC56_04075 [Candidatus Aquicultor sp.]